MLKTFDELTQDVSDAEHVLLSAEIALKESKETLAARETALCAENPWSTLGKNEEERKRNWEVFLTSDFRYKNEIGLLRSQERDVMRAKQGVSDARAKLRAAEWNLREQYIRALAMGRTSVMAPPF